MVRGGYETKEQMIGKRTSEVLMYWLQIVVSLKFMFFCSFVKNRDCLLLGVDTGKFS